MCFVDVSNGINGRVWERILQKEEDASRRRREEALYIHAIARSCVQYRWISMSVTTETGRGREGGRAFCAWHRANATTNQPTPSSSSSLPTNPPFPYRSNVQNHKGKKQQQQKKEEEKGGSFRFQSKRTSIFRQGKKILWGKTGFLLLLIADR